MGIQSQAQSKTSFQTLMNDVEVKANLCSSVHPSIPPLISWGLFEVSWRSPAYPRTNIQDTATSDSPIRTNLKALNWYASKLMEGGCLSAILLNPLQWYQLYAVVGFWLSSPPSEKHTTVETTQNEHTLPHKQWQYLHSSHSYDTKLSLVALVSRQSIFSW